MFEHLRSLRCIVVTGPQRSGTTICAQMIAADTGHVFIDEGEFGTYDVERWRDACSRDGVVVQCPHMLKIIVDERDPGKFVVLMRRSLGAIHASEDRIAWRQSYETEELALFENWERGAADTKYLYWDNADHLPPFRVEIEYDTLVGHPLWIEDRTGFHAKQTAL